MKMEKELFKIALRMEEPIFIEKIEFEQSKGELHIYMNFKRGCKFACPICGKRDCSVHDTTDKTWRHLDFFQYKCFIHFKTPSTKCSDCGVHLFVPFWGRVQSGFTALLKHLY